jgi:hypothetical protein
MRSILASAPALLLLGSAVAGPADPAQLAETGPTCWATRIAAASQMRASRSLKQRCVT